MRQRESVDGSWRRLADRVRRERESHGWTQVELATRTGLSRPTIQNIESAVRHGFSMTTLRRLEQGLGWAPRSVDAVCAGGEPVLTAAGAQAERQPMYYLLRSLVLAHGGAAFMAAVADVFDDLGYEGHLPP